MPLEYPDNNIYYRLYDGHNGPCVVTMQWFDEPDYDEKLFLSDKQYDDEEEAETALLVYKLVAETPLTYAEKHRALDILKGEGR